MSGPSRLPAFPPPPTSAINDIPRQRPILGGKDDLTPNFKLGDYYKYIDHEQQVNLERDILNNWFNNKLTDEQLVDNLLRSAADIMPVYILHKAQFAIENYKATEAEKRRQKGNPLIDHNLNMFWPIRAEVHDKIADLRSAVNIQIPKTWTAFSTKYSHQMTQSIEAINHSSFPRNEAMVQATQHKDLLVQILKNVFRPMLLQQTLRLKRPDETREIFFQREFANSLPRLFNEVMGSLHTKSPTPGLAQPFRYEEAFWVYAHDFYLLKALACAPFPNQAHMAEACARMIAIVYKHEYKGESLKHWEDLPAHPHAAAVHAQMNKGVYDLLERHWQQKKA